MGALPVLLGQNHGVLKDHLKVNPRDQLDDHVNLLHGFLYKDRWLKLLCCLYSHNPANTKSGFGENAYFDGDGICGY